ncbi:MAG: hypothetical protein U0795_24730 [Pirellulales bacterium]
MIAPIEYEYEYRDAEYEYEEFNRRTIAITGRRQWTIHRHAAPFRRSRGLPCSAETTCHR